MMKKQLTSIIKLAKFGTLIILMSFLFELNQVSASNISPDTVAATPSPTYDPLVEPVLPDNPSELELGEFWYWHNCMTCHGDLGQGLTDEFRAIWPEDHQNCWAHGCHNTTTDAEGFPIPTYVPPLVRPDKLTIFTSPESLVAYLKSTHPPQDPGVLGDDQYQAIVKFLFAMNERSWEEAQQVSTSTATPPPDTANASFPASEGDASVSFSVFPVALVSVGIIVVLVLIWRLGVFLKNR